MKSAVVVIDVQHGLFDSTPEPADAAAVIARINRLTAHARAQSVAVIFVHHERDGSPLSVNTPGWALDARLVAEPTDLRVRKTTPDSFLRTDLAQILTAQSIQQLILCGYATEFCVDTTVRSAAAQGYDVILAADAHTTHDKAHADAALIRAHHNATLPNITSFGARIRAVPVADIAFHD